MARHELTWSAVQRLLDERAGVWFDAFVDQSRVLDIMARAQDPALRDQARADLIDYLQPLKQKMAAAGADIVHFHLPEGVSFYRSYQPDRFGDSVIAHRHTIRHVNERLEPSAGVEAGRLQIAYRSSFPILDAGGELLGSVEFSVPLSRIQLDLVALNPGREHQILLRRDQDALQRRDDAAPRDTWFDSQGLFTELPMVPGPGAQLSPAAHAAASRIAEIPRHHEQLLSNPRGFVSLRAHGQRFLVVYKRLLDARGETIGVLLSYAPEPGLTRLARNLVLNSLLALLALALIALAAYGLNRNQAANNRQRERLLTITRSLGQGLLATDRAGRITETNPVARQLLGRDDQQLRGMPAQDLFAEALPFATPGERVRARTLLQAHEGPRNIELTLVPLYSADGMAGADGTVVLFDDISERIEAERDLMLAASVFRHSREAIVVLSPERRIIAINQAGCEMIGYSRTEVLGQGLEVFLTLEAHEEPADGFWAGLCAHDTWVGELWVQPRTGQRYPIATVASVVRAENGQIAHYLVQWSDASLQKQYEEQLLRAAYYDALTGLPNRVLLTERLQQAMDTVRLECNLVALAVVDLDAFKLINERHGSEVGDQLLNVAARRLRLNLPSGAVLGRLGGDEFAIVLPEIEALSEARQVMDGLLGAFDTPAWIAESQLELQVSISIGLSFFPQQGGDVDPDQLLRQADQAMYRAKLAGKNRCELFDIDQDLSERERLRFVAEVTQAVQAGELCLYYQPKVNLRSGEVLGMEALIRWQHPTRGLLGPGAFLPLIEHRPVEIEIGRWVLRQALLQAQAWQAEGRFLPIAVNIAGDHLQHAGFVAELGQLLDEFADLRRASLSLEIVETSALEDVERMGEVIKACCALGVHVELDDFGTGYSSLTYLKRLPVTGLKIDQSFVRDMFENPDDLAILEGVLGLARAFGHGVIAEGVESVEEGRMLLRLGCEHAQGYAIARPMPADVVVTWLGEWQPYPAWTATAVLPKERIDLVYAMLEHRAWVAGLSSWLEGRQQTPPLLDAADCRLGRRLRQGVTFPPGMPGEPEIRKIHDEIHAIGNGIMARRQVEADADFSVEFETLCRKRDRLVQLLDDMLEAPDA